MMFLKSLNLGLMLCKPGAKCVTTTVGPTCGRALLSQAVVAEASVAPETAAREELKKERTSRVDQAELLRRTFALDVFGV
jgi:hypothetical protein